MMKCNTTEKIYGYIGRPEYVSIYCRNVTPRVANYIALIIIEKYGNFEPLMFKYLFEEELNKGAHSRMFEGDTIYRKNN